MSQTATALIYSGRVRQALRLCESAHRGTMRKSGDVPYMAHPVSVAMLLAAAGADEDTICAGLLHDVAEDTPVGIAQINDMFGQRVAMLVAAVTKVEFENGRKLSKDELNDRTIAGLAVADICAAAVKAADLICNLSDVIFDAAGDPDYLKHLYGEKADAKIAHYLRLAKLLMARFDAASTFPLLREVLFERAGQIAALGGEPVQPSYSRKLPLVYSGRVRAALQLAEQTHRGDLRKGTELPFILHPISVAALLAGAGADDDLICAAYLEDAVEEGALTATIIEDRFGSRVAGLVAGVTKPDTDARGRKLSSQEKDEEMLGRMSNAPLDHVALKAADLCANIADLVLDQAEHGQSHWQILFGDRVEQKLTHYMALVDVISARLRSAGAYPELRAALCERAGMLAGSLALSR